MRKSIAYIQAQIHTLIFTLPFIQSEHKDMVSALIEELREEFRARTEELLPDSDQKIEEI